MEKGLNAYKIKIIALLFMILDHVYSTFNAPIHNFQPEQAWPQWIPVITRLVSPVFLFLMIEGFYHTRSRKKYLVRLITAGLIMLAGNVAINYLFHRVDTNTGKYTFGSLINGPNILLTLACLFVFVWCLENMKQRKYMTISVLGAIVCICLCGFLEGGVPLLPIAFLMWVFREKKDLMCIGIFVWCVILLLLALYSYYANISNSVDTLYGYLCFDNDWGKFLVIPFIYLYNGERGKNTAGAKYFFYGFYPVHIWILRIARLVLFGR